MEILRSYLHYKSFAGEAIPAEAPSVDTAYAHRSFSVGIVTTLPLMTLAMLKDALFGHYHCSYTGRGFTVRAVSAVALSTPLTDKATPTKLCSVDLV